jgi:hypothetical protein
MPELGRARKRRFVVVTVALTLMACEAMSYAGQRILVRRGIIYQPPGAETVHEIFRYTPDPRLGWPSPERLGRDERDRSGSRVIPSFPDPDGDSCASAYGDSFTWGSEVTADIAWANVLSKILNCRVSNFGVGGYGTDQAYLRFTSNERDHAKVVLIGYFAENLIRNVIQYQAFLYPARGFRLKPRFVLDNGALKLLPYPRLSEREYQAMTEDPARFLTDDYLTLGGPTGTLKAGFPFTLSMLRSLRNFRIQAQLRRESFWAPFYRKEHPSHALEITTLILQAFDRDVKKAGRTPVVVMFPWVIDLREYQQHKTWSYQPLIDNLRSSGIDVLNLGEGLAAHLGGRSVCGMYVACASHLTQEGNEATARLIADYLRGRRLTD